MSSFELPLSPDRPSRAGPGGEEGLDGFPAPFLAANAHWHCQLRWAVVTIFAAFGVCGFFPETFAAAGLRVAWRWPLVLAGLLCMANVLFLAHIAHVRRHPERDGVHVNLHAQIVLDLIALTFVVHFVGSVETPAPFTYLFHIVLACIFFPRRRSLAVTVFAFVLYASCLGLEMSGAAPSASIYADRGIKLAIASHPVYFSVGIVSTLMVWLGVWYLTSRLSNMVRDRDRELARTNLRLVQTQEEKKRHMRRTTHELKAPFAAIHANTQLLLKGYCGELPDEVRDIVTRIGDRCERLSTEIKQMLQLARLVSEEDEDPPVWGEVDLADVLTQCADQLRSLAAERGIEFEIDLSPARVVTVREHLEMLFDNVLSNAVIYSLDGGKVQVQCKPAPAGGAVVVVEDHGIGIAPEKLPLIFDEYYRTDEAVRHNKQLTGLGLAIMLNVARKHGIRVRVDSAPGAGTRFRLGIPAGQAAEWR